MTGPQSIGGEGSGAPARLGYRPALDGIRGLSIAGVIASHFAWNLPWTRPAQMGVDVFLVLSGFLITTLLLEERERAGRVSLGHFYLRRAARLLPALFLMLAVVVPVSAVTWPQEKTNLIMAALAAIFYVTNWMIIASQRNFWILPHLWSLAVEEQFYLLWPPLLVVLLRRGLGRGAILAGVVVMFLAVAAWRVHLLYGGASPNHMLFGFDARADELLAGCVLAMARSWELGPRWLREPPGWLGWAAGAVAWLIGAYIWERHEHMESWGRPMFVLAVAVFVVACLDERRMPGRLLSLPPLVELGKLSYSVYLWHLPVFLAMWTWYPGNRWPAAAGALVISLEVARFSYRFVEKPILAWAHRRPTGAESGSQPATRLSAG